MQSAAKTRNPSDDLASLRRRLNERFGAATGGGAVSPRPALPALPTGIPVWDAAGGLPQGQLTEACGGAADGALLLESILTQSPQRMSALVDAVDSLEPADWPLVCMARLLWVRCRALKQALHATDLLLRDGNCQLLALNLQRLPARQLASIPASTWHRFHRLVELRPFALVVLSPHPLVEGAKMRLASSTFWDLSALDTPRRDLFGKLNVRVFKRGSCPQLFAQTAPDSRGQKRFSRAQTLH
jgi:hypothetical protein